MMKAIRAAVLLGGCAGAAIMASATGWTTMEQTDAFTDEVSSGAHYQAYGIIAGELNAPDTFYGFKCAVPGEPESLVFVADNDLVVVDGDGVQVRGVSRDAKRDALELEIFPSGLSSSGGFMVAGSDATKIVREMQASDAILVRYARVWGGRVTGTVLTEGFNEAIAPVLAECGITP